MKRIYIGLLCLLLRLTMLTGCTLFTSAELPAGFWEEIVGGNTARPATTVRPEDDVDETYPPHASYKEYERLYTPLMEPEKFSTLAYERPDAETLCQSFNAIAAQVATETDVYALLDVFDQAYDEYVYFSTMGQLAYIRYTLDLNDAFYTAENTWCEEQTPVVEQALEKCYIAMAKSPLRQELEELYFTPGFFEFYDENQIYSNDRVVALMQQESELQNDYMAMLSDMTITWKGKETLVDDLLAENLSYEDLVAVYELYYEKYNPQAAEIFVDLIRVRKALADELGYDSYADFAYEFYYQRDYTPDQVATYTSDIAESLSGFYFSAIYSSYTEEMDTDVVEEKLKDLAYTFGDEIATAYDYMCDYELSDFTVSSSKMPGSYMTYLPYYEMPYLYVSPTGSIDDLLTATHEFGHFVDGFVNCNTNTAIDCAEIFSQGLEYLALDRADLTASQRSGLTQSKMADAVLVFLSQACYAEFEQRAYELPDSKLNAQGLNDLFWDCYEEFGMALFVDKELLAPGWMDVQHFFIAPFYVISYCISNDAALQIYEAELETGTGLDVYYDLLYAAPGSTVLALLEEADLTSPFAEDRMEELVEFFQTNLN